MSNIHYVIAGALTKDLLPEGGHTPGGTVFYSGIQAARLGANIYGVCAVEPSLDTQSLEAEIKLFRQASAASTTFENIYDVGGNRTQYLRAAADPLDMKNPPKLPHAPQIVQLAPLTQSDVPINYADLYPEAKIAVTPQGWMRHIEADGRVRARRWDEAEQLLPRAWAMVLSEEDVEYDEGEIARLASLCPVTVCTRNLSAASLFVRGQREDVPVYPTTLVDPTGAGDVFAAAFFLRYFETDDPLEAVNFAHIAAAVSISGQGISRVIGRDEILALRG